MQWEYLVAQIPFHDPSNKDPIGTRMHAILNEFGSQGWEAFSSHVDGVHGMLVIMKKPKE